MMIERESPLDAASIHNGEGDGVTKTPVLIGMPRNLLSCKILLCQKGAYNRQTTRQ
jgi:hypothetical protein